MAAKILTSLTFQGKTIEELRRECSEFSQNLYDFVNGLVRDFAARPRVSDLNPAAIGFGQMAKFSLAFGQILDVQLPRPNPLNGGLMIHVVRVTATGTIVLHAVDCLINGFDSAWLPASVGLHVIAFDGENYYSAPALARDWGSGL